jgi:ABC-type spermidine/putrescine transport system permease subunit I
MHCLLCGLPCALAQGNAIQEWRMMLLLLLVMLFHAAGEVLFHCWW